MKNKISLFRRFIFIFILLTALVIASWAALVPGFFRVHDFTHGARIAEYARAFGEGQFPVRWSGNFGYGYGMPAFEFYAPLPYAVASLAYWLTGSLHIGLIVLWVIPSIGAAWGMYRLMKIWWSDLAATVAAVSLTLAPYRAVDLYVRGAVGEAWGIMWFSWIMFWLWRVIKGGQKLDIVWLSLCIAGLTLSHNLMTMIFTPFIIILAFSWLLTAPTKKLTILVKIGSGIMLGFGLGSWYLIPALMEKGYTQLESRILGGYFHYSQHFLYIREFLQENWGYGGSNWGPKDDLSFFLGYGQLALLIVLGMVVSWRLMKVMKLTSRKLNIVKNWMFRPDLILVGMNLMMMLAGLYMSLLKSTWIWELLPILATVQFPWRFISLSIVGMAVLNGFAIEKLTNLMSGKNYISALITSGLLLIMLGGGIKYFQPEFFLDKFATLYYDDPQRIRVEMSGIWPDFIPLKLTPTLPPRTGWIRQSDVNYEILVERGHQLAMKFSIGQPQAIAIAVADFPGWQAYLDGQAVDHRTSFEGLVEVDVPAGEHLVSINLERTPVRLGSEIVSIISGGVLLFLSFYSNCKMHFTLDAEA